MAVATKSYTQLAWLDRPSGGKLHSQQENIVHREFWCRCSHDKSGSYTGLGIHVCRLLIIVNVAFLADLD